MKESTSNKNNRTEESFLDSKIFKSLSHQALGLIGKPMLVFNLAQEALDKSGQDSSFAGVAKSAVDSVQRLVRLVISYTKGTYRGVETGNIVKIIAAILYFVSPLDVIPDFIPVIGYLDDITIIAWVIRTLGVELDKFSAWEEESDATSIVTTTASSKEETPSEFASMTYTDLYAKAREIKLHGRSSMNRKELAEALEAELS